MGTGAGPALSRTPPFHPAGHRGDVGRKPSQRAGVDEKLAGIIFQSISDGVFTVNRDCIITSFNEAAEQITGFSAEDAIGKHCFEIFRTEVCHRSCALRDTLANHGPVENARVTIITEEGCEIPISVSTTLLKDEKGETVGAVEFFRDLTEVEHLRHAIDQARSLKGIVSASDSMQRLIAMLPSIAESECNVLVQGPSGSGKELFAQAIHNLSPRRYGPYIRINCAALPHALLESELFGYVKGAFTDAKRDKPGQFCLANGGTLLLDEISEMEPSLQVKLLRVLNNGEFQPLGSTKSLHTDARIIAATNADLETLIKEGRFREDLYYRINVVNIELPPLKDRPGDLPVLVQHFIEKFRPKFRKAIRGISDEALRLLRGHSFPGNVRELENIIEHSFVMCGGEEILAEHLPRSIVDPKDEGTPRGVDASNEKEILEEAIRRNMGNRNRTARELGMHRSTLWRKLKAYGIDSR